MAFIQLAKIQFLFLSLLILTSYGLFSSQHRNRGFYQNCEFYGLIVFHGYLKQLCFYHFKKCYFAGFKNTVIVILLFVQIAAPHIFCLCDKLYFFIVSVHTARIFQLYKKTILDKEKESAPISPPLL